MAWFCEGRCSSWRHRGVWRTGLVFSADDSGPFDIAAQSAEVSLNEFALQAERSILVVRRGAGAGVTTRRLHGEFTVEAALTRMLAGTRLQGRIDEWCVDGDTDERRCGVRN